MESRQVGGRISGTSCDLHTSSTCAGPGGRLSADEGETGASAEQFAGALAPTVIVSIRIGRGNQKWRRTPSPNFVWLAPRSEFGPLIGVMAESWGKGFAINRPNQKAEK